MRLQLLIVLCLMGTLSYGQEKNTFKTPVRNGNPADTLRHDSAMISILSEVTVSASRMRESLLRSPVSIQKVGEKIF